MFSSGHLGTDWMFSQMSIKAAKSSLLLESTNHGPLQARSSGMFSLHWFSQHRQRDQLPQKSGYWLCWGWCYDVMVLVIYPSDSFTYRILKVLGRTLRDFLSNLDNLHEYLRFSYPKIKPPSFFVTDETPNGLTLHYRSKRKGFVNFVMGQVSALYSSQIRDHDRITQSILVTHPSIQSVDLYKRGPEMPLLCWMFKLS